MPNCDEFITYKYEIIKKLINSQEIIDLLTNQVGYDLDGADDLLDKQIMSYRFVPEVENQTNNYLTLSTKVTSIKNNTIMELQTSIYIIVPYALIKLPSSFKRKGNRIDNLVFEINKLLNDTRTFGIGKIEMLPNAPFSPAEKHDGFEVRFKTIDFNT